MTKMENGKKIFICLGKEETLLWISVYTQHTKDVDDIFTFHCSRICMVFVKHRINSTHFWIELSEK